MQRLPGNPDLQALSHDRFAGIEPNSNVSYSKNLNPQPYFHSYKDVTTAIRDGKKFRIVSLGSKEKGFFSGINGNASDRQSIRDLYAQWSNGGKKQALAWLSFKLKHEKYDIKLHPGIMTIPQDHVRMIQSCRYDYFQELQKEYCFYQEREDGPLFQKTSYYLTHGGLDVSQNLQFNNPGLMIIFSLEGIHTLGIGYLDEEAHLHDQVKDVSTGILKKRIRQLKGEEPLENGLTWEHRPLYITFCGHFNNTLCGHSRSLPLSTKWVYNQNENLDKGILKEDVFEIWRELLSLDEDLKSLPSQKIYVDVTHMSAATRSEFYKKIIRKYNLNIDNLDSPIPVIASRAAYSGIDLLEEMVRNNHKEKGNDTTYKNGFLTWNINLTDEDVIEIHRSRGLIGITTDEYLLGGEYTSWINRLPIKSLQKKRSSNLIKRTLEQFVRIPYDYNVPDPGRIWDLLFINTKLTETWSPLERYSCSKQMNLLEEDLSYILESMKRTSPEFFEGHDIKKLTNKICFENERDFIIKNYC